MTKADFKPDKIIIREDSNKIKNKRILLTDITEIKRIIRKNYE